MKGSFNALCKTLHLDASAPTDKAMAALRQWYLKEVSEDKNAYVDVKAAEDYLDVFLPNLPANHGENLAAFQDMNAVQYAAAHGYDRFLKSLDRSEVNLFNLGTKHADMTPLHLAATFGHVHEVELLLQRGADPRQKDCASQFPIQSALFTPIMVDKEFKKRKELIFNLLKTAAPDTMSSQDMSGDTLAHKMAAQGYTKLMKEIIKDYPTLLFQTDNFLKYPIHKAILNLKKDVVKVLMPVDDIPNLKDTEGRLALHYAAASNDVDILKVCIPYYKTVEIPDLQNRTPLLIAASSGSLETLRYLVKHKANVQATDSMGLNLLHHVVNAGEINLLGWILDNLDLDVNAVDGAGETALDYANRLGASSLSSLLIQKGAH